MITGRQSLLTDVDTFNFRPEDREEMFATYNLPVEEVIRSGIAISNPCLTGEIDGKMFCILGCVPEGAGANLWMIFANIDALPLSFYRLSKQYIAEFLRQYEYLHGYVNCRNDFILKWVKWLGCELSPPREYGAARELHQRFFIGRA